MFKIPAPNYSNVIVQIVKRLKEDKRLSDVEDDSIVEGGNLPRVVRWPAITVLLERVDKEWRSFGGAHHGLKTAHCTVKLNVFDRVESGSAGYVKGLQSVEGIVQSVDDIFQSDMSISGVSYKSETTPVIFNLGTYDNTPVIGAEVELVTSIGYARS